MSDGIRSRTDAKLAKLHSRIVGRRGILVALSGGVDSALLLSETARFHKGRVVAVTVVSELQQREEKQLASRIAKIAQVEHRFLRLSPLEDERLRANTKERCYYCKRAIFTALRELAEEEGLALVIEGSNADDLGDYRPGRRALAELGIGSPLLEAGLNKAEIRQLAHDAGLPNASRPSQACLASRVPYGTPLDAAKLDHIAKAETHLHEAGFPEARLRDHGDIARIEVDQATLIDFVESSRREGLVVSLKALGFTYVVLDLEGYRMGAMNEVLTADELGRDREGSGS